MLSPHSHSGRTGQWVTQRSEESQKLPRTLFHGRLGPWTVFSNSSTTLKIMFTMAIACLLFLFVGQGVGMPLLRRFDAAGLEVLQMGLSVRVLETIMAVVSVVLVACVYTLLIRRGALMSTTSMYPIKPIETDIGRILTVGWLNQSEESFAEEGDQLQLEDTTTSSEPATSTQNLIWLFYLGKMTTDTGKPIAKGVTECGAKPEGAPIRQSLWLTSGSALNKNIVQVLVWEWVSAWLILLMLLAVLLWNGFFTKQLNLDSYPRLTVILMYCTMYIAHFCYTWIVCSRFFTYVAAGASWSLLEKAKFVVGDQKKLRRCSSFENFDFRSIDKANQDHVPTTFNACIRRRGSSMSHSGVSTSDTLLPRRISDRSSASTVVTEDDDLRDVKAAIATLSSAQKEERDTAQKASSKALDRVMTNAVIMLGITLSSGFSSWTSSQLTANSPNNTVTMQIGSLALLASLSLGAAAMFTSAMHLSIVESSFHEILALKEIKINGQAVDYNKKRTSTGTKTPLSFTKGVIPLAPVTMTGLIHAGLNGRLGRFIGLIVFGPAFGLLPTKSDNALTSVETRSEVLVNVRNHKVLFTTQNTDKHLKTSEGENVDPVNVCYVSETEKEKDGLSGDADIC